MRLSRRTWIFGLFCSAYFLSQFYRSANAVISRDLVRDVHLDAAQLGLMTSLFYLCFAAVQLPLGTALDRWGARRVTPALMLAAAAGSLVFASGHDFARLALGRALIGAGMAGVYMGGLKAFSRWFGPRGFAASAAYMVGIGSTGALFAATPLAWITQAAGWRAVFDWAALATVISVGYLLLWVRDAPPDVDGRETGDAASLRRVFAEVRFWRIATVQFAMVGTFLSIQGLWGGPFLFDVLRVSRVQTGNFLLELSAGALAGYFVCGTLAQRLRKERLIVAAVSAFTLSLVMTMLGGWYDVPVLVHVAFPLFGMAAAFNPLLMANVREVFPTAMTGRAITAVNLFGMGGATLIQWGMGVLIGAFAADGDGHYPPVAYLAAFALVTLLCAAALVFYWPMAYRPARSPLSPRV